MVLRGASDLGSWELVRRPPHPALRSIVREGYEGYAQAMRAPVRRLEVPHGGIVLVVGLGPAIDVDGARHTTFLAGLHDAPVVVSDSGHQACIQANLTPLGAWMLLGRPMRDLRCQTVAIEDLLGRAGAELGARVAELETWTARFAALDAFLLGLLRDAPPPRPDVAYAWSRLEGAHGGVAVAELCRELRCSGRHLAARFGEQVGLPPKAFARVLRFERATALLRDGKPPGAVAAACGYFDQPHLNREFRALSGRTPASFAASVMDVQDGLGVAA